jgi:hypothetical protein
MPTTCFERGPGRDAAHFNSPLGLGVPGNDALMIGMANLLLICVAALAGYLRARKASQADLLARCVRSEPTISTNLLQRCFIH